MFRTSLFCKAGQQVSPLAGSRCSCQDCLSATDSILTAQSRQILALSTEHCKHCREKFPQILVPLFVLCCKIKGESVSHLSETCSYLVSLLVVRSLYKTCRFFTLLCRPSPLSFKSLQITKCKTFVAAKKAWWWIAQLEVFGLR